MPHRRSRKRSNGAAEFRIQGHFVRIRVVQGTLHFHVLEAEPARVGRIPQKQNRNGQLWQDHVEKDLPTDAAIKTLIKQAVELNEKDIKAERRPPVARKDLVVPDNLLEALARDEKASETFNNFPYSCKKEYVEWITDAKTDATREKKLATTIEWLGEGKRRNWKYENC